MMSSKHVDAWNKHTEKECMKLVIIQNYFEMHGQQNIKNIRVWRHHWCGEVQNIPLFVFPCIGEDKLAYSRPLYQKLLICISAGTSGSSAGEKICFLNSYQMQTVCGKTPVASAKLWEYIIGLPCSLCQPTLWYWVVRMNLCLHATEFCQQLRCCCCF